MEQKDNTGVLFKNETKTKDTQPDYTGVCVVDGKEKRLACWIKTSSTGKKYMSVAFSESKKQEKQKVDVFPDKDVEPYDDFGDDEVPF